MTHIELLTLVEVTAAQDLPAGRFSDWLDRTRRGLASGAGSHVPCGACNACCRSGYFVHVEPDETETLAQIPAPLLVPAPGLPDGHRVMGYDEAGRCPMLVAEVCSIYAHRPRACRTYDCRVFAVAGVDPGDGAKADVARRAARWAFDYADDGDRLRHAAVKAAASYLEHHPECMPGGPDDNPTRVALMAIEAHEVFLDADVQIRRTGNGPSASELARAVTAALAEAARRRR